MTTDMVRKQIYIKRRQENLLKILAKRRGVSESEIIRQAIERETSINYDHPSGNTKSMLEKFLQLAELRKLEGNETPYHFSREDIYEDRINRWIKDK